MPQLDKLVFLDQVFFLILFFFVGYFWFKIYLLPGLVLPIKLLNRYEAFFKNSLFHLSQESILYCFILSKIYFFQFTLVRSLLFDWFLKFKNSINKTVNHELGFYDFIKGQVFGSLVNAILFGSSIIVDTQIIKQPFLYYRLSLIGTVRTFRDYLSFLIRLLGVDSSREIKFRGDFNENVFNIVNFDNNSENFLNENYHEEDICRLLYFNEPLQHKEFSEFSKTGSNHSIFSDVQFSTFNEWFRSVSLLFTRLCRINESYGEFESLSRKKMLEFFVEQAYKSFGWSDFGRIGISNDDEILQDSAVVKYSGRTDHGSSDRDLESFVISNTGSLQRPASFIFESIILGWDESKSDICGFEYNDKSNFCTRSNFNTSNVVEYYDVFGGYFNEREFGTPYYKDSEFSPAFFTTPIGLGSVGAFGFGPIGFESLFLDVITDHANRKFIEHDFFEFSCTKNSINGGIIFANQKNETNKEFSVNTFFSNTVIFSNFVMGRYGFWQPVSPFYFWSSFAFWFNGICGGEFLFGSFNFSNWITLGSTLPFKSTDSSVVSQWLSVSGLRLGAKTTSSPETEISVYVGPDRLSIDSTDSFKISVLSLGLY